MRLPKELFGKTKLGCEKVQFNLTLETDSSMGKNLATILAPEGVTVNIVSPAMIQATGMIPTPKNRYVFSVFSCIRLLAECQTERGTATTI